MTWILTDDEFRQVVQLPATKRYEHFVKRCADWGEIWGLTGASGWTLAGAPDGRELLPVWPHAGYAQACATGEWEARQPEAISLEKWLETYSPGLEDEGRQVAVFPAPQGAGIAVDPRRLKADLEAELSLLE